MIYSKREVNEQLKVLRKADCRAWTDWERGFILNHKDSKAEDLSDKVREKISQIWERYCQK